MKSRVKCQYRNVCGSYSQSKCRSCALRFAPYDLSLAAQIKKDSHKSKYKYEDTRDLAQDIMAQKSAKED